MDKKHEDYARIVAFELADMTEEQIFNRLMQWQSDAIEMFNNTTKNSVLNGIEALSIVSQA